MDELPDLDGKATAPRSGARPAAAEGANDLGKAGRPAARALVGIVVFSLLLPAILFGTAGRIDWVMGWVYVAMVYATTIVSRVLVSKVSPDLLDERARSLRRSDVPVLERVLLPLFSGLAPLAIWILAGLHQRQAAHTGDVVVVQVVGAVCIAAGSVLVTWAMTTNRFFSAVVRVQHDRGHVVISSGPYAWVRHPGYAGVILINLATPVMLGSAWALLPAFVVALCLAVRIVFEERALRRDLDGYQSYMQRTRYRVLPGIW